jgi:hypothetical protein
MAKAIIDKALEELFYPTILSNGFVKVGKGKFLTRKNDIYFLIDTDITSGNHLRFGLFQILEPMQPALRLFNLKGYGDWLSPYGVGRKVHLYSCDSWDTALREHADFKLIFERIVAPWILSASPIPEPGMCSYQTNKVKWPSEVPDFISEVKTIQRLSSITELKINNCLVCGVLENEGFIQSPNIAFQLTRKRGDIYDVLRGELDRDGLFLIFRVYCWVPAVEDAPIDFDTVIPRMTNGGWLGDREIGAGRSWLAGDVKLNKEIERSIISSLKLAALPYFDMILNRTRLAEEVQSFHERQYLGRDTYAPIQHRVTGSSTVGVAVKWLSPILAPLGAMFMEPDTFVFGSFPETISLALRDDQNGVNVCIFDFRGGEAKERFLSKAGTLADGLVHKVGHS